MELHSKKTSLSQSFNFVRAIGKANYVQYSKTCVTRSLSKGPKMVFKTNYRLMQGRSKVLQNAATLSNFIKLPFVIKTFVVSIFKWPL